MNLSKIFWLIAVVASIAAAAAMAAALFFFGGRTGAVSGSIAKEIIITPIVEKVPAVINNLYAFAMVSGIAYLLFLLFNDSLGILPATALLFQCLFVFVFRFSGLSGRLRGQWAGDIPSRSFLIRDRFLILSLALLHTGSCISLLCAGTGH